MKDISNPVRERQARKAVALRLQSYFASLTAELDKDAEEFFVRVMELSKLREPGQSTDEQN